MAAPAPQGTATTAANTTASTNASGTVPTGVAVGELLFAQIKERSSANVSTPASGWTFIRDDSDGGTANRSFLYWKIATASETAGSTVTWVMASSVVSLVAVIRISGHDPATPIDAHDGAIDGSGATMICPSVNTLGVDRLVMRTSGTGQNATGTVTVATEQWDFQGASGTKSSSAFGATETVNAQGATGTRSITPSGAFSNVTQTVAIASPAAPTSLIIPTETVQRILSRR